MRSGRFFTHRCCSSSTLTQTQVFTLLLRLETVAVAAAAAVPEASALVLLGVEEPHHGVVLTAALVLVQEADLCTETRDTDSHFDVMQAMLRYVTNNDKDS